MSDAPPAAPAADPGPLSPTPDEERPRTIILALLAAAPGQSLKRGELNAKTKTRSAEALGVTRSTLPGLLDRLAADGLVRPGKAGRAVVYALTEAGSQVLTTNRHLLPPGRAGTRGQVIPPASDAVQGFRTNYVLLQVLRSPRHELSEGDANGQLDAYAREALELNAATATQLRRALVGKGLLVAAGDGRATRYRLTPAGRMAVGNATFPADRTFPLPGRLLNDLLEVAREVGKQFAPPPGAGGDPVPVELPEAILAAAEDLIKEQAVVGNMVPISDVRAVVRERLGTAAGRAEFDAAVRGLSRAGRVRLVPLFDPSRATPEQLRDSLPGVGETLFYLEVAREPAPV